MMSELRLNVEFFSSKILGNKKIKGEDSKEVWDRVSNLTN